MVLFSSRRIWTVLTFIGMSFCSLGQTKHTISGTVTDGSSNETLIGVNVYIPELQKGAITNSYGFYSITLEEGNYVLLIQFLGYKSQSIPVELNKNVSISIQLQEDTEELEAVVISADKESNSIRSPQMSVNTLTSGTVKQIPAVLGEPDLVKAITFLPGVTNAGEGSSGFNVRGGSADQNLILLDEAILYNSSHLFGLFSVFNPDAIKDLKLFKGGIPARYGGRLSSVLDIYQKDGNSKSHQLNGGVGLVSSKLLVEGPLKQNLGSYLLAGRGTYAHLFLPLVDNKNIAYFYDLNTKLSYQFGEKDNLLASGYFGRDVFSLDDSFRNVYGNAVFNMRWNHLFSDKLFSNLSMIYSDYYYGLRLDFIEFNWKSGIQNFNLKYDFKHYLTNDLTLQYGLNSIYHSFNPGIIEPSTPESSINYDELTKKYAIENAVYFEATKNLSTNLALNIGLRWSHFTRLGQTELNYYANDQAVLFNDTFQIYQKATPIGVRSYKKSDVLASFNNLEPRFSASYLINDLSSVKLSYNRMSQYLHLLSNTSSPTPLDVWTPSGPFIKPQLLDQYAIGYATQTSNGNYSIEIESYFKSVKNRIDYIDGANLVANDAIEQVILNGRARAYGVELLLKKNLGRLNGWLAYTYSISEQQTPGRNASETGINSGKWYRTAYDKTHDLSAIAQFKYNKKWTFNANFVIQTGQPVNYPNAQYEYNGLSIANYGERNSFRLPSYHRLDLSASLNPRKNLGRKWQGEWIFGIYNVYGRKNAVSIAFRDNIETGNNEAVKTSLFGMVPSISYNFKF